MKRTLRSEIGQRRGFSTLEEEVHLEVLRTAQLAGRWVVEALKPSGLTPSQFNVLRILRGARPEPLSSRVICERMVHHDPDLTRLLDRLEAAGLIAKERCPTDRRVVHVRITQAGLDSVETASRAVSDRVRRGFGPLGEQRLNQLADLLERVRCAKI
jgi:DNA-binding MarR family transcriptional regulator